MSDNDTVALENSCFDEFVHNGLVCVCAEFFVGLYTHTNAHTHLALFMYHRCDKQHLMLSQDILL